MSVPAELIQIINNYIDKAYLLYIPRYKQQIADIVNDLLSRTEYKYQSTNLYNHFILDNEKHKYICHINNHCGYYDLVCVLIEEHFVG